MTVVGDEIHFEIEFKRRESAFKVYLEEFKLRLLALLIRL